MSTPRNALDSVPTEPQCGASIELHEKYVGIFTYPNGKYWAARAGGGDPERVDFD